MSNDFNEASSTLSAKQAVAVNTSGDRVQFNGVRILGNQDTLLVNTSGPAVRRLYVRKSYVEGDVDFIFGGGTMVFQQGEVRSLTRGSSSNNGYITAAATNIGNPYGFLFWQTHLTSLVAGRAVHRILEHRPGRGRQRQPAADEQRDGGAVHADRLSRRLGRLEPTALTQLRYGRPPVNQ